MTYMTYMTYKANQVMAGARAWVPSSTTGIGAIRRDGRPGGPGRPSWVAPPTCGGAEGQGWVGGRSAQHDLGGLAGADADVEAGGEVLRIDAHTLEVVPDIVGGNVSLDAVYAGGGLGAVPDEEEGCRV